MKGAGALLRNHQLRHLYLGIAVSDLGSSFGYVAIPFAVLRLGGPGWLGMVLAARALPSGILVLVGGYWADRLPRQRLMVGADSVRAVAQAVSACSVVAGGGSAIVVLITAQAAYGAAEAFFTPASRSIVPRLVQKAELPSANALMGLTRNITRPLGPAMAGFVVAGVGSYVALGIDAFSFLLSGLLVSRIRLGGRRADGPSAAGPRAGIRAVVGRDWLVTMIGASFLFQAAALGPLFIGGPIVASALGGPVVWGLLLAAVGCGAVLGSLLAARLSPPRPLVAMSVGVAATAPYVIALATRSPIWLLIVGAVVYGAGLSVVGNIYFTTLHTRIPDEYLGRVLAIDEACSIAALPLSQLAAGALASAYGTGPLLGASGIAVLLSAAALVTIPGARRLTTEILPARQTAGVTG